MSPDLVIIGAGSAGLGAAKAAEWCGLDYVVLEASHRIGGRAYTETPAPGIHFDLGCHWIHTASRNPFTHLLHAYDMEVQQNWKWRTNFFIGNRWIQDDEAAQFEQSAHEGMAALAKRGKDIAAMDTYDRNNVWAPVVDYWISLNYSTDPDQVSLRDITDFEDTGEGEDWPVKQGLGTLLSRFGSGVPVSLNSPVIELDSTGKQIVVKTKVGDISAPFVIVTVSTGILNAGDIKFTPSLPEWKRDAIENLQLGNHNRICLVFDRDVFDGYTRDTATYFDDADPPMSFSIRPFGLNYAVGVTGGRFADWLERAGQQASIDYARERLVHMFGADAGRHLVRSVVSAWRGEPWIRGAYSATAPGAYGARGNLAEPIDEKLLFAGEATSENFMDTVHGAYISGVREALRVGRTLAKTMRKASATDPEKLSWLLTQAQSDKAVQHECDLKRR